MGAPVKIRPLPLPDNVGWNREALAKKKRTTPITSWVRGWELRAASDEDLVFPSWAKCRSRGLYAEAFKNNNWVTALGVDPSGKKRRGTALTTIKVHPVTLRRYIVDVRVGRWKIDQLMTEMTDVDANFHPAIIMVEDNGVQEWLQQSVEYLKLDFWFKLQGTTTGDNKHRDDIGLPGLQVQFQNEGWVVPWAEWEDHPVGHHTSGCPWCTLDYEFQKYPLAASSDLVMSTWFAEQGVQLLGAGVPQADKAETNRRTR